MRLQEVGVLSRFQTRGGSQCVSGFAPFPDLLSPLPRPSDHLSDNTRARTRTLDLGFHGLLGLLGPCPSIYWFSGYYFGLSYLPPPNPFLSYLFPLSYRSFLLFIVRMMVAPATPSHSILVSLPVPNTGKHGLCAGLCANHLRYI
jgi:hypothetical protein